MRKGLDQELILVEHRLELTVRKNTYHLVRLFVYDQQDNFETTIVSLMPICKNRTMSG